MESEKKPYGFIIFTNDLDKTARLSDADFRQWVTACVVYANSGEVIDIPDMAAICFDFVRGRIDDYKNKYEKQAETSRENGRKGGRPPKPKETYENPAGFSETQQNHKYRLIDKRTEHIDQNIKKHALSEEVMEEIEEGSGEGKEEPASTGTCQKIYIPPNDEEWERLRDEGLAKLLQSIGGQT